jgi:protein-tyrosine phosphatase
VEFLDSKHGKNWAIWEFRAEGTGYPDSLVYNRIRHYPWPDHHPPPFRLVPMIMASMRNWLNGNDLDADGVGAAHDGKNKVITKVMDAWKDKKNGRVIVVHCKAGKGRSGTSACSFLISECGWTPEEALARFTERRMRPKFGAGVSIPSQLRWVGYVDRWTKGGKTYVDREIEIVEIHVWGLRNGVKLAVEGFVDEGKKIKVFHTFKRDERVVVEGDPPASAGVMDTFYGMVGYGASPATEQQVLDEAREVDATNGTEFTKDESGNAITKPAEPANSKLTKRYTKLISPISRTSSSGSLSNALPSRTKSKREKDKAKGSNSASSSSTSLNKLNQDPEPGGRAVIFKPHEAIRIPTSDVNITIERRNRAPSSMGLTMVTAVAHVWFNAFFEGNGPEQEGKPAENGVFDIEWDKMDGIKGSSQKGTRAADRIAVVWRFAESEATGNADVISEPGDGSPVPQMEPADWKGGNEEDPGREKKLGLRVQSPDSANVSQASSIKGEEIGEGKGKDVDVDSIQGVKSDLPIAHNGVVEEEEENRGRKVESDKAKLEAYAEKLPSPEGSGTEDKKQVNL